MWKDSTENFPTESGSCTRNFPLKWKRKDQIKVVPQKRNLYRTRLMIKMYLLALLEKKATLFEAINSKLLSPSIT